MLSGPFQSGEYNKCMKILVVEDEKMIAKALKKGLEQEKFVVDLAFTGTDGYDLAESEEYDLIVLDVMLPGLDGFVICQRLREEGNSVPILMLTAKSQIPDKVHGLEFGADDYLTKPFAFEELVARIRALLRRPKGFQTETLQVRDLLLEPHTFEVSRTGKKISLSSKEFSLLSFLMRHVGQIVSKDMLISQVWDYESDVLPNTVEVTIRHLRQKIDQAFPDLPPLIKTVRGYGYKIEA